MFIETRMKIGSTALCPFGTEQEMIPLLFKWFNSPEIVTFMGDIDSSPFTVDDARNYFNSHKKDTWVICSIQADKVIPIGYTGLFIRKRHRVGIFRIAIAENGYQGNGHAKAATKLLLGWAFGECDLRTLHLSVSSANLKAISLYKKTGFTQCGIFSKSRYENGHVEDEILMEITRQNWEMTQS